MGSGTLGYHQALMGCRVTERALYSPNGYESSVAHRGTTHRKAFLYGPVGKGGLLKVMLVVFPPGIYHFSFVHH